MKRFLLLGFLSRWRQAYILEKVREFKSMSKRKAVETGRQSGMPSPTGKTAGIRVRVNDKDYPQACNHSMLERRDRPRTKASSSGKESNQLCRAFHIWLGLVRLAAATGLASCHLTLVFDL